MHWFEKCLRNERHNNHLIVRERTNIVNIVFFDDQFSFYFSQISLWKCYAKLTKYWNKLPYKFTETFIHRLNEIIISTDMKKRNNLFVKYVQVKWNEKPLNLNVSYYIYFVGFFFRVYCEEECKVGFKNWQRLTFWIYQFCSWQNAKQKHLNITQLNYICQSTQMFIDNNLKSNFCLKLIHINLTIFKVVWLESKCSIIFTSQINWVFNLITES